MVSYVRGRSRRLPDDEIVRLYVSGLDSATVAFRAGCDSTTVLDIVRAAGGTVRKPGGKRKPNAHKITDAEIRERYLLGHSGPEIADAAECAVSSIYNILQRNGVPRRNTNEMTRAANDVARTKRLRGRPAFPE
jgi:hypothetical protein